MLPHRTGKQARSEPGLHTSAAALVAPSATLIALVPIIASALVAVACSYISSQPLNKSMRHERICTATAAVCNLQGLCSRHSSRYRWGHSQRGAPPPPPWFP